MQISTLGPDAFFELVVDRPQVQVVGFDVPEVSFDVFEVLVGAHHAGGVQLAGGHGGAQHVEAVQGGFGVDLVLLAGYGQAGIGDGHVEVLGGLVFLLIILVFADHFADLDPDWPGAGQPPGLDAGDDGGQQLLGRLQQVFPLASALSGQHRVAAGDQPLAGEVRAGDLGQVLLIEQG
jgi:hypothetical protein